jgi:hypothetical protein
MNCRETRAHMQRSLDLGAVDLTDERASAHLARCAGCRSLWQQLRAVEDELGALGQRERERAPSGRVHAAVMPRLMMEGSRPRARRGAIRAAAVIAVAAALLTVIILPRRVPSGEPRRLPDHAGASLPIPAIRWQLPERFDPETAVAEGAGGVRDVAASFGALMACAYRAVGAGSTSMGSESGAPGSSRL